MTTVHGSMDNDPIIDETAAGSPDELLDAAHDIVLPGDDRVLHLGDNSERDPAAAVVDRLLGFRVGPSIEIGDELADFLVNDRPRRVGVVLSTFVVPTETVDGTAPVEEIPAFLTPDRSVVPLVVRRRGRVRVGMAGVASLAAVATLGMGQVLPAAAQTMFSRVVGVVGIEVGDGSGPTTHDARDTPSTSGGAITSLTVTGTPTAGSGATSTTNSATTPGTSDGVTSAAGASAASQAGGTTAASTTAESSETSPAATEPEESDPTASDPTASDPTASDPSNGNGNGAVGIGPGGTPPGQGGTPPGQAKKTEGVTP